MSPAARDDWFFLKLTELADCTRVYWLKKSLSRRGWICQSPNIPKTPAQGRCHPLADVRGSVGSGDADCEPLADRASGSRQRRVTNPPQVANLPHMVFIAMPPTARTGVHRLLYVPVKFDIRDRPRRFVAKLDQAEVIFERRLLYNFNFVDVDFNIHIASGQRATTYSSTGDGFIRYPQNQNAIRIE